MPNAFAKLSEVKVGDTLSVDGGFECFSEGAVAQVQSDEAGNLFILCAEGRHYIRKVRATYPYDYELYGFFKIQSGE